MESANTFIYLILTILTVSVLWGAYELHQLRESLDGAGRRAARRERLSPHLFDQEQP